MLNLVYFFATILYFSSVIAYSYDVQHNCDCDIKWYFDYLKYFSIAYIILTIILVGYVFMLHLANNITMVWHNTIMQYIIYMMILLKTIGLVIYFYSFYQLQKIINDKKDKCGCFRNKFYDIINISTYIYLGIILLGLIISTSKGIIQLRIKYKSRN